MINEQATNQIKELIEQGWEFNLHWGNHKGYIVQDDSDIPDVCWEADFTKKLESGLWDNHKDGYSLDINEAINQAYLNIKNGNKLK